MVMAAAGCLVIAFAVTTTLRDRAATSTPQATTVPSAAVQLAESSVVGVRCINAANETNNTLLSANGTGFLTRIGTVTAAHVIVSCASAGPGSVSAGPYIVSVGRDDPTDDLALLQPHLAGTPLALQEALPRSARRSSSSARRTTPTGRPSSRSRERSTRHTPP